MIPAQVSGGRVVMDKDERGVFERLRRIDLYNLFLANGITNIPENTPHDAMVVIANSYPEPLYGLDAAGNIRYKNVEMYYDAAENSIRIKRPTVKLEDGTVEYLEDEKTKKQKKKLKNG